MYSIFSFKCMIEKSTGGNMQPSLLKFVNMVGSLRHLFFDRLLLEDCGIFSLNKNIKSELFYFV
jgi:hypothetical protein